MFEHFFLSNMFAIQGIMLILTYFDLIQTTVGLKDRLMIYFAFQRFLADIKLTETYFSVSLQCFCIAFIPTFWHINCRFSEVNV